MTFTPVQLIAVPLFAAFLIPIIDKINKDLVKWIPGLVLAYLMANSMLLLPSTFNAPVVEIIAGWEAPFGITLVFGPLGGGLAVMITIIAFIIWIYSLRFIIREPLSKYYMLFMLLTTGATGIVLTGDIFNLFVFLEITAIAAYSLTAFLRDHDGAEAAFKYLLIGSFASSFVLLAIMFLYAETGTLNMAEIASLAHTIPDQTKALILILFVVGLGIEAELFPLNGWAPDAYSQAPSPIGAVFAGIVVKAAVYALMRVIFTIFQFTAILQFLTIIGVVTLLIAEMAAMKQRQIKRMLAFSSIGQMGLVIIAFSLGSQAGIEGALFQMLNHAIIKVLLFFTAGYLVFHTGTKYISDLVGVGNEKPITAFFFSLAALAIIGLPPFSGFWSKLAILMAIAESGQFVLIALILFGSVIEAIYYLRVISMMYHKTDLARDVRRTPFSGLLAMGILAILILYIGFQPGSVQEFIIPAAKELLNPDAYIQHALTGLF